MFKLLVKLFFLCASRHCIHRFFKNKAPHCDLKGFDQAVLSISGVVLASSEVVFDHDPRHWPSLMCAGQNAGLYYDPNGRRMSPDGTFAEWRPHDRLEGLRHSERHNRTRQHTATDNIAHTAASSSHSDSETSFWQGPGRIYTGTVQGVSHSSGTAALGTFEYVRPYYVRPSRVGTAADPYKQINSLEAGSHKVYTPWQYNLYLTTVDKNHAKPYNRQTR